MSAKLWFRFRVTFSVFQAIDVHENIYYIEKMLFYDFQNFSPYCVRLKLTLRLVSKYVLFAFGFVIVLVESSFWIVRA
jgi:hypothetical protein